jgi:hypothetical protein
VTDLILIGLFTYILFHAFSAVLRAYPYVKAGKERDDVQESSKLKLRASICLVVLCSVVLLRLGTGYSIFEFFALASAVIYVCLLFSLFADRKAYILDAQKVGIQGENSPEYNAERLKEVMNRLIVPECFRKSMMFAIPRANSDQTPEGVANWINVMAEVLPPFEMIVPDGKGRLWGQDLQDRIDNTKDENEQYKYISAVNCLKEEATRVVTSNAYRLKLPDSEVRREGMAIFSSPGRGKTSCIESLIVDELESNVGIIFMDSVNDTIKRLVTRVDPKRLVYFDPNHAYPTFNLFDVADNDASRSEAYGLLRYLVRATGEDFTAKQQTIFDPCIQLIYRIPNANMQMLRDLVRCREPAEFSTYRPYLKYLPMSMQDFFENDFFAGGNKETKDGIVWRLSNVTNTPFVESMIDTGKSNFDFRQAMDQGKVIVISTNRSEMGATSSELVGRIFISEMLKAVMRRKEGPDSSRRVYCYIDEFHQYCGDSDTSVMEDMFTQTRKRNFNMCIATQTPGQIPSKLSKLILGSAIKLGGASNPDDEKVMAKALRVDLELLQSQPRNSFVINIRDMGSFIYPVIPGRLDELSEFRTLKETREAMSRKYSVPYIDPVHSEPLGLYPVEKVEVEPKSKVAEPKPEQDGDGEWP